jgi:chemotaxis protein CheC
LANNPDKGVFPPQLLDAFSEIINIGMGRAASQLNQMVSSKVLLQVPKVEIISLREITSYIGKFGNEELFDVGLTLTGDISGTASLFFLPVDASKLVSLLTRQPLDSPDLDTLRMEVLNEVGNIMINSVVGSIANMCHFRLNYSIPTCKEGTIVEILGVAKNENMAVIIHTTFTIDDHQIEGNLLLVFNLDAIDNLVKSLENPA